MFFFIIFFSLYMLWSSIRLSALIFSYLTWWCLSKYSFSFFLFLLCLNLIFFNSLSLLCSYIVQSISKSDFILTLLYCRKFHEVNSSLISSRGSYLYIILNILISVVNLIMIQSAHSARERLLTQFLLFITDNFASKSIISLWPLSIILFACK